MPITPASKTAAQITAKLAHYEKKREVAYARLPTGAQNAFCLPLAMFTKRPGKGEK